MYLDLYVTYFFGEVGLGGPLLQASFNLHQAIFSVGSEIFEFD